MGGVSGRARRWVRQGDVMFGREGRKEGKVQCSRLGGFGWVGGDGEGRGSCSPCTAAERRADAQHEQTARSHAACPT